MNKRILALTLAGTMSLSLLSGCSNSGAENTAAPSAAPAATKYTYADTIAWDGQYDVVVVGFGGAGAVASSTAADEGANVLLLEKAPEGHEGGNTRYCGQMFVYGDENEEATYEYYKAMAGTHEVDEEMLRVYTKEIAHMYDVMEDLTGIDQSEYFDVKPTSIYYMSPEYPELPGSEHISLNALHSDGLSDGYLWKQLRTLVTDRADKIDVWFESPATHLIQDPETKTIIGVQVEREGKTLNIRANNGVVMACGGFENNLEMVQNYTGLPDAVPGGTKYNTGDGVNMVLEIGADLWHMEAYEWAGPYAKPKNREDSRGSVNCQTGAGFVVDDNGERFFNENEHQRHGHTKLGNFWVNKRQPNTQWIICDETFYDESLDTEKYTVYSADTIEELAELIDVPAENLANSLKMFNSGKDELFDRDPASIKPLSGNKYYAIEGVSVFINTQGGARRNANAEIVDPNGNAIPHLYSAGEFGGITANLYQGGGNVAECVIFGKIAGKNAAAAKDELPTYEARQAVESTLTYTPGKTSDIGGTGVDVALADGEYLGTSTNGMGGELIVKVTMDGDKIANVEIVKQNETEGISDPAREQIPGAIVEANSTEVDNVSGATITSKAIKEAVEDALSQVK